MPRTPRTRTHHFRNGPIPRQALSDCWRLGSAKSNAMKRTSTSQCYWVRYSCILYMDPYPCIRQASAQSDVCTSDSVSCDTLKPRRLCSRPLPDERDRRAMVARIHVHDQGRELGRSHESGGEEAPRGRLHSVSHDVTGTAVCTCSSGHWLSQGRQLGP